MDKGRLQELAGIQLNEAEEEIIEEGEVWDLIKGTAKIVMIMKSAMKKAKKIGKTISPDDPDKVKKVKEEMKNLEQYVRDEVGKLNIDDDIKQSTISSFVGGMEEQFEKLTANQ